jgi:putative SOS response-associated peptidase YedK
MPATFNTRAETVAAKLIFRNAFKKRRCIIFPNRFFERTSEGGSKQQHLFTAADGSPALAFAGLWDRWLDAESGELVLSRTIVVSGANTCVTPYHDRRPVLFEAKVFDRRPDGSHSREALKPAAKTALREWKTLPRFNKAGVGDDEPTIIEPLSA